MTINEAQELIKKVAAGEGKTEEVSLMEAGGRILAEEIRAWQDNPPFPRSPYDGYALRAEDIQDAGKETPVCLRVVEKTVRGRISEAGNQAGGSSADHDRGTDSKWGGYCCPNRKRLTVENGKYK